MERITISFPKLVPVNLGPYLDMEGMYYVDTDGNIFSTIHTGELKPLSASISKKKGKDGHLMREQKNVSLYTRDNFRITRSVHRVVLESFSRAIYPEIYNFINFKDLVVDHIDGNPLNNKLENLRWLSNFENNCVLRKDTYLNWEKPLLNKICKLYFEDKLSILKISRLVKKSSKNIGLFLNGTYYNGYAEKWCKNHNYDYEKIMENKQVRQPKNVLKVKQERESFDKKKMMYEKLISRSK